MKHQNIVSFIAKDIQKTCEKLGIYADFKQTGDKVIESDCFRLQPAIYKDIFVRVDLYVNQDTEYEEDMVITCNLRYRYTMWDGGMNGCNLGQIDYRVQKENWDDDRVYLDDGYSLVNKQKGLVI